VRTRRGAALVVLAAVAAGCGSSSHEPVRALPASGPPNVIRVGLADLLWPLEPERAKTRDEIVLARMLFSTPLRTSMGGALRPGLCTSWRSTGATWRLRCSHAGAIAAQLQRVALFREWRVSTPAPRTLVIRPRNSDPDVPYELTQVAAAPSGVPGPFRLISASPTRVVAERNGVRVDVRKLEPYAALKLFRAGKLDEAPVPLGDIRAVKLNPLLARAVRVRRLLAADVVSFSPSVPAAVRKVYDDTADRADYQALVPEFQAPPAENLSQHGQPSASKAAIALRDAKKRIAGLPRIPLRFQQPRDPTLNYGLNLLVASWRDLGLGVLVGGARQHTTFERLLAPYPRPEALTRLGDNELVVPIAWVADARLVSPRLRGWSEDELGNVDYAGVRLRGPSRSR
jgi:hypothetical protein